MEDLSLHIMDIVENALRARAENIQIKMLENDVRDTLTVEITDDGHGMDAQRLRHAADPFYTTKADKKIGLGLSLLSQACTETGGKLTVADGNGAGVKVVALFNKGHVDMKPLGDIPKTLKVLRIAHPQVNLSFEHIRE